ncbi:hypothetical protein PMIN03_009113, partial [Paraphaeosphaeria minitans]
TFPSNLPPWTRLTTKCNPISSHKRKDPHLSAYDAFEMMKSDSRASEGPFQPATQLTPRTQSSQDIKPT